MNKLVFDRDTASKSKVTLNTGLRSDNHHFQGQTRRIRSMTKNVQTAFLKRVSARRAKKGYAHNI